MMRIVVLLALAFLFGGVAAGDEMAAVPAAVISDPAPDLDHPASSAQVLVPSHGKEMNGLIYLAAGAGPHPTLVLLHGFPGNEQNLDLAQAARRAGWNVLTMHYRGSWGSPGTFSIAHVLEDGDAAVAFVRRSDIAERFGIDRDRIVLAGHSMGGFASASHARKDGALLGVALIDAWNVGGTGARLNQVPPAARRPKVEKAFNDLGHSLKGATPSSVAAEIVAHRAEWNYLDWASALTGPPVLVIGAERGLGKDNDALAAKIAAAGGKVTAVTMPTDHSFNDHRIALAAQLIGWLQALPAR